MLQLIDPQTFWVNATNLVLGVVTLCCVALIGSVVINEILERTAARLAARLRDDDHAIRVGDLGMTMADGGERVDDDETATGPDFYGF
jgi:hypothetical protein